MVADFSAGWGGAAIRRRPPSSGERRLIGLAQAGEDGGDYISFVFSCQISLVRRPDSPVGGLASHNEYNNRYQSY